MRATSSQENNTCSSATSRLKSTENEVSIAFVIWIRLLPTKPEIQLKKRWKAEKSRKHSYFSAFFITFAKKWLTKDVLLLNLSYICTATRCSKHKLGKRLALFQVDESGQFILKVGIGKALSFGVVYIFLRIRPKVWAVFFLSTFMAVQSQSTKIRKLTGSHFSFICHEPTS